MGIKKVHIGKMRSVGTFENNVNKQAKTAGYIDGYSPVVASVFCFLEQKSHRKVDEFGQIELVSYWEMHCRFQTAIDESLLNDTKFVQGERVFTIVGFKVIDEKNLYYMFTLNLKDK